MKLGSIKSTEKEEDKKTLDEKMKDAAKNEFRISPKEFVKIRQNQKHHGVMTEGKAAPSMTSTSLNAVTENKLRGLTLDEIRNEYHQLVKSRQLKGYAKIQTNIGPLNFEIYANLAPKASENFLELLENGYYNGTKFHRLIPNFMIQGGDPEGNGLGGDSYFGGPFSDEFSDKLSHNSRGILAMANSGPNTNKSQFYITFGKCEHLDNKHTIFGKLVGGFQTLDTMEAIPTGDEDRPKSDIEIIDAQVFGNPFRDVIQEIMKKEYKQKEKQEEEEKIDVNERWLVKKKAFVAEGENNSKSEEIGKYLKPKNK